MGHLNGLGVCVWTSFNLERKKWSGPVKWQAGFRVTAVCYLPSGLFVAISSSHSSRKVAERKQTNELAYLCEPIFNRSALVVDADTKQCSLSSSFLPSFLLRLPLSCFSPPTV